MKEPLYASKRQRMKQPNSIFFTFFFSGAVKHAGLKRHFTLLRTLNTVFQFCHIFLLAFQVTF